MMPYMYFDSNKYFELDDVELDIESLYAENHRKNGVEITLPSLSGFGEIEFHISFKDTVNFSLRLGEIPWYQHFAWQPVDTDGQEIGKS